MSYDGRSGGGGYGPVPSPHGGYDGGGGPPAGSYDGSGYGNYPPTQAGGYGQPGGYDQQQQGGYGQSGGYGQQQQGQSGGYHQQPGGYAPQEAYSQGYSQPQTNYQIPQTTQQSYAPSGGYPPQAGYPTQGGSPDGDPSVKGLSKPTTTMSMVFFAAACCVMFGACLAGIFLLLEGDIVEFLMMFYLLIFGTMMAILDTPFFKQIKATGYFKMYIGKYLNILMRVTGKGLAFVFLACTLFTGIWNPDWNAKEHNNFLRVMGCLLCPVPFFVGLAAIVVGLVKSKKLKGAQDQLKEIDNMAGGSLEQRIDQWAQTYRGERCALTPLEFNKLCEDTSHIKFEDPDLKLIFDALVSNPKWRVNATASQGNSRQHDETKIPKEDLLSWVRGTVVCL